MNLVANARMYALTPGIRDLWAQLFAWVAQEAGEPLTYIDHAAPAPLEDLWRRSDLGVAFACGYPFALGTFPIQPVAAPLPAGERYCGHPLYATDLVVRADSSFNTLPDTFGGRIGWTVEHSQSGFHAVRAHLATYRRKTGCRPLYREAVGPLVTPRRVIEALLEGRIDVGPLDSYAYDLLVAHEPGLTHEIVVAGPSLMNDDVPSRWRGEDHVNREPGSASQCGRGSPLPGQD